MQVSPVIKEINEDGSYKTILQVYQEEKDQEGFYQIYPVSPTLTHRVNAKGR